ncbi:hypothetical protein BH09PSE5_BH09PSE5_06960 [soil metagenome]
MGTAEEQRVWWIDVGNALAEGKVKVNRDGLGYAEWSAKLFPGLAAQSGSDAIWFAQESMSLMEIPAGMSNPSWIRRWFNEQQRTLLLPHDLQEVATTNTPDDGPTECREGYQGHPQGQVRG